MLASFPVVNIVVINLFWILYLLPGFAVYKIIRSKALNLEEDSYFAKKLVFSFFLTSILLLPLAILPFFFTVSFAIGAIYFLILLAPSILYLLLKGGYNFAPENFFKNFRGSLSWWSVPIFIFFSFDFLMSTIARSFLAFGGDVWTHISKINHNVHHGFSIFDPYFIDNGKGIIQSTHPSNLVHIILSLASGIAKISALDVWAYSGSFFRIIAFATVYVLARELIKNRYFALLIAGLFYLTQLKGEALLTILYPANQSFFAAIFLIIVFLLIVKNKLFSDKIGYLIYAASILLVAFTHQIQFSLIALFLGGLSLLLLALKQINLKGFLLLTIPFLLGLPNAVFSLKEAKFISTQVLDIGSDSLFYFGKGFYALKYPSTSLDIMAILTIAGLFLATYFLKDKFVKIILYFAVIFNIVLLYTPLFMAVNRFIPTWGIQRYEYLNNLFTVILVSTIIWYLLNIIWKGKNETSVKLVASGAIFLVVALPYQFELNNITHWAKINNEDYRISEEFRTFNPHIKPGSVVMAEKDVSFFEPAIADCYIVGIDHTRTTNAIDTTQREKDNDNFFFDSSLSSQQRMEILTKYNVAEVILVKTKVQTVKPESLGLKRIAEIKDYYLYER